MRSGLLHAGLYTPILSRIEQPDHDSLNIGHEKHDEEYVRTKSPHCNTFPMSVIPARLHGV